MNLSNPTFLIALLVVAAIVVAAFALGIYAHKHALSIGAAAKVAETKFDALATAATADIRAAVPKVEAVVEQVKDAAETEALALLSRGVAWLIDTTAEDTAIADAKALIEKVTAEAKAAIDAALASKAHKATLLAAHQQNVAALKVA